MRYAQQGYAIRVDQAGQIVLYHHQVSSSFCSTEEYQSTDEYGRAESAGYGQQIRKMHSMNTNIDLAIELDMMQKGLRDFSHSRQNSKTVEQTSGEGEVVDENDAPPKHRPDPARIDSGVMPRVNGSSRVAQGLEVEVEDEPVPAPIIRPALGPIVTPGTPTHTESDEVPMLQDKMAKTSILEVPMIPLLPTPSEDSAYSFEFPAPPTSSPPSSFPHKDIDGKVLRSQSNRPPSLRSEASHRKGKGKARFAESIDGEYDDDRADMESITSSQAGSLLAAKRRARAMTPALDLSEPSLTPWGGRSC